MLQLIKVSRPNPPPEPPLQYQPPAATTTTTTSVVAARLLLAQMWEARLRAVPANHDLGGPDIYRVAELRCWCEKMIFQLKHDRDYPIVRQPGEQYTRVWGTSP